MPTINELLLTIVDQAITIRQMGGRIAELERALQSVAVPVDTDAVDPDAAAKATNE